MHQNLGNKPGRKLLLRGRQGRVKGPGPSLQAGIPNRSSERSKGAHNFFHRPEQQKIAKFIRPI